MIFNGNPDSSDLVLLIHYYNATAMDEVTYVLETDEDVTGVEIIFSEKHFS